MTEAVPVRQTWTSQHWTSQHWTNQDWTSQHWTNQDLRGTAQALPYWWDLITAGVPSDLLDAVPGPGELSVARLRAASEAGLTAARSGAASGNGVSALALEEGTAEGAASAPAGAASATAGAGSATAGAGSATAGAASAVPSAAAVEAALALSRAGRVLAALGAGTPPMTGEIVGVHVSDGGVPKRPLLSAYAGPRGLEGDRQAARKHHGRVWQAVCLWSAEVIEKLQAEGHPIAAGCAGENVTIRGVDWAQLRPGARLQLGGAGPVPGALVELSVPALPCRKNARWFRDGRFSRMQHERHPGDARWYASVLVPGVIASGAPVVVEPLGLAADY